MLTCTERKIKLIKLKKKKKLRPGKNRHRDNSLVTKLGARQDKIDVQPSRVGANIASNLPMTVKTLRFSSQNKMRKLLSYDLCCR